MCVVRCVLFVACYMSRGCVFVGVVRLGLLCVVRCSLFVVRCLLLAVCCLLLRVWCSLVVVRCLVTFVVVCCSLLCVG